MTCAVFQLFHVQTDTVEDLDFPAISLIVFVLYVCSRSPVEIAVERQELYCSVLCPH